MKNVPLPDLVTAALPTNYEAAKIALAECARVDECQGWADKMAAMASYAWQSGDSEMAKMCQRIQNRAVRRVGELLKEVPSGRGHNQYSKEDEVGADPIHSTDGIYAAGRAAKLSSGQIKTSLRVANVPQESFEKMVDSDEPPTVSALAAQGRQRRTTSTPVSGRIVANRLMALVRHFAADIESVDIKAAMRGFTPDERSQLVDQVLTAARLLRDIMQAATDA